MSMRSLPPIFLLAAAVAFASAPVAAQQDAHDHAAHQEHADHAHPAATDPAALPATPWATDAPLRENMRLIRQAVEGLAHYEMGHLSAQQAGDLADEIRNAVNAMFANCKLEAEADAALHGLLATFLAGANEVRTQSQPPSQAIARMRESLDRYPKLFDDPHWLHEGH
ncbi:MAG TPA: DnrO protein [Chiayiivirga sp.]|nr:DnrO protein [Chiayiivirga sp.]